MNRYILKYPLLYKTTPIFSENGDWKLGKYWTNVPNLVIKRRHRSCSGRGILLWHPEEILRCGEISGGPTLGLDFRGEILLWGKILFWDIKRGKYGPRINLSPWGNPSLGWNFGGGGGNLTRGKYHTTAPLQVWIYSVKLFVVLWFFMKCLSFF